MGTGSDAKWRDWPLTEINEAVNTDRGGLGILELLGPDRLIADWHYTLHMASASAPLRRSCERAAVRRAGRGGLSVPAADPPPRPPSAWVLFRLLGIARSRMPVVVLGFVLTLATTIAGLIPPYLTMPLADEILIPYQYDVESIEKRTNLSEAARERLLKRAQNKASKNFSMVPWYLAGLVGAAIAAWLLGWGQVAVLAWASERSAPFRNKTYSHLQSLSLAFFGGKRTGDLMSRVSTDTDRICNFLSDSLMDFLTDALLIVGTAAILLYVIRSWRFSRSARFRRSRGRSIAPEPAAAWVSAGGAGLGGNVERAGGHDPRHPRREGLRPGKAGNRAFPTDQPADPGCQRSRQPRLDLLLAAGQPAQPGGADRRVGLWGLAIVRRECLGRRADVISDVHRPILHPPGVDEPHGHRDTTRGGQRQRIFEILDRSPSVPEPANPIHPQQIQGDLEFRGVGFRYGDRRMLEQVDFRIRPGEMIGLVGPQRRGKSTMVNLVCRFYDVSEGAILVDGIDIPPYAVEEYRRHIGIVLQDPFLFFGTIAENIAYGRPEASRAEVISAAKSARRTSSSCSFRTDTIRSWVNEASRSRGASGSGF